MSQKKIKILAIVTLLLLVGILGPACNSITNKETGVSAADENLVWPSPPEEPKVKYLYTFNKPKDLGIETGFIAKLLKIFGGEPQKNLLRPYSIAVDDGLIAIADPSLKALHLFDTGSKKYKVISYVRNENLASPVGVALDGDRIYLSDSTLGKVFVLNRTGKYLYTIQGVKRPTGLALHHESGRLYVADTVEHHISVFDKEGKLIKIIGRRGGEPGEFNFPTHLAIHKNTLYVNDTLNYRIQVFDLDGRLLRIFGKLGDGSGQFAHSKGVGVDAEGHIYVADALSNYIQIFDSQGRFLLAFGGLGTKPGQFVLPAGLYVSGNRIYVADSQNRRIQVFEYLGDNS